MGTASFLDGWATDVPEEYNRPVTTDELIAAVEDGTVVSLEPDDLERLLDAAEVVRTDATGVAGSIRTLRLGGRVLVQERSPEGAHFMRALASEDAARRFVDARLAAYDRMWDG